MDADRRLRRICVSGARQQLRGIRQLLVVYVLLLVCTLLLAREGLAQSVITGRVTDRATGLPVESANIFLGQTTHGTSSGHDGRYRLAGLPAGQFDLVVSQVGYEPARLQVQLSGQDTLVRNLVLVPRILPGAEVQVIAPNPEHWKVLLQQFTPAFLGETDNARECRIVNPEVLNLREDPDNGRLLASSDTTLLVENRSLGYMVSIVLISFSWDIESDAGSYQLYRHYQELQPKNAEERAAWKRNREHTSRASMKRFLAALMTGTLQQTTFQIHSGPLSRLRRGLEHPVTVEEVRITRDVRSPYYALQFDGWWRVDSREGGRESSYIALNKEHALVDEDGNLADPLCFDMLGYWSKSRVADMLPLQAGEPEGG